MEVVVVLIGVLAVAAVLTVKPGQSGMGLHRLRTKAKGAEVPEETLKARLERRLKAKQDRHRNQMTQWDETYFAELPVRERPDLLGPAKLDVEREKLAGAFLEDTPEKAETTADFSHIPIEELSRFYSRAELTNPQSLDMDRFDNLRGSTERGNCIGCGRFKKKTALGYYICRDEYFRAGAWRHRF